MDQYITFYNNIKEKDNKKILETEIDKLKIATIERKKMSSINVETEGYSDDIYYRKK